MTDPRRPTSTDDELFSAELPSVLSLFTDEQRVRLEEASAINLGFPHELLKRPRTRRHVFDGTRLENHT